MLAAKAACGLVKTFCLSTLDISMLRYEAVVVPYKNDDITGAMTEFCRIPSMLSLSDLV